MDHLPLVANYTTTPATWLTKVSLTLASWAEVHRDWLPCKASHATDTWNQLSSLPACPTGWPQVNLKNAYHPIINQKEKKEQKPLDQNKPFFFKLGLLASHAKMRAESIKSKHGAIQMTWNRWLNLKGGGKEEWNYICALDIPNALSLFLSHKNWLVHLMTNRLLSCYAIAINKFCT